MTLRTKSPTDQWKLWLIIGLVSLAAYVMVTLALYGSVSFDLLDPLRYRIALPCIVFFFWAAWETRRMTAGRKRNRVQGERREDGPAKKGDGSAERPASAPADPTPAPEWSTAPIDGSVSVVPLPVSEGEALYERARALPHQVVPDFLCDGPYLDLLGQAAEKGYAPASAKLGDYAMRRAAWVEAYYWMSRARRQGMQNLESVMREIRKNWASDGFPEEVEEVAPLFTEEKGSVGRALLDLSFGRQAAAAREYLKAWAPDLL